MDLQKYALRDGNTANMLHDDLATLQTGAPPGTSKMQGSLTTPHCTMQGNGPSPAPSRPTRPSSRSFQTMCRAVDLQKYSCLITHDSRVIMVGFLGTHSIFRIGVARWSTSQGHVCDIVVTVPLWERVRTVHAHGDILFSCSYSHPALSELQFLQLTNIAHCLDCQPSFS